MGAIWCCMTSGRLPVLRRNRDLLLVAALAVAGLAFQLPGAPALGRVLLGLPLAVLCPGYALSAALLPASTLGWPEKTALTLGLSLALAILGAIVFTAVPSGLTTGVWAGLALGGTALGGAVAVWRRRGTPPAAWPGLSLRPLDWAELGLAVLVTLAALWLVRVPLASSGVLGYTLLTMTPNTSASQPAVELLINSSEFTETTYHLTVSENGAPLQDWPAITLAPGGQWLQTLRLPATPANGRVQAQLYRSTDPTFVYRSAALDLAP
jgi:hypothetical protein